MRARIDLGSQNSVTMDGEPGSWRPRSPPGRGEMAERFSRFDWSGTAIGAPQTWPASWRNAVQVILDSSFPTALGLGKQLVYFYNDAFIPIGGPARHPSALGLPVPIAWKEIWEPILLPRFSYTLETGEPTGEEALLMPLQRSGYLEETYITFSFAALRDDEGQPSGIFCTAYEQTGRVIADRQLRCLRALGAQSSLAETPEGACHAAAAILEDYPRDLPFGLLYLLDRERRRAQLAGTCGLLSTPAVVPATVMLESGSDLWKLSAVVAHGKPEVIENVQALIGGAIRNTEVTPAHAVAIPIAGLGEEHLAGVLIAGANPMRPLQESRAFHELVAGQLETAISSARAKQHARERAQALAELDRAKTLFFSNISHELRTPLTLLLAPLDDVLHRDHLTGVDREALETGRRGGGRLLKLVNSLLEFSRIEAGRIEASYEPVDLAMLTADLASVFRSAFERARVALMIDCPTLAEPVYVDRDMWEKIVLNLVSNAFKFTFSGEVRVSLRMTQEGAELEVADTGCGVASDDLPRLFERFFRGRAPQARTHEGSGIGLSLVQELVKLHGGTLGARSKLGHGTTMTVCIPRGWAHLPSERVCAERALESSRVGALPFVEEALGWLVDDTTRGAANMMQGTDQSTDLPAAGVVAGPPARILVVDDNADMRAYLCRLLRNQWQVDSAQDGGTALIRISEQPPDLVIADVMMPGIDGFALLRRLRDNEVTAEIPVMLLSARAGEEASAEGLRAGADDYLIKPFSARELLARVQSRLSQARLRAAERCAREVAENANRARDNFFAVLSHELRTPLAAVMAWVPLLREKQLDSAETGYALEVIERATRLQRRLVNDLLDVSQIVTGRMRIEARNISTLAPVVSTIVDCFRPVAHQRALHIETQLDSAAGPLNGDADRLQQVAWNLLSNAIKFTQAGGTIEIRCARTNGHVELSVRDTGKGIAPEALPRIFERHWQDTSSSSADRRHGLGLGLAITQKIVELHGGSISVASAGEGQGAMFTVHLPVAEIPVDSTDAPNATPYEPQAQPAAATRALDAATAAAELDLTPVRQEPEALETLSLPPCGDALNGLRVLLVEDNEEIAKAFDRLLVSHGHSVVRARGITGALHAIDRTLFDVLICDVTLCDGSGLDLLPRIRANLARRGLREQLPAIAISGRAYPEDIVKCLAAGFAMHLAKPFDASTLLTAMAEVTRPPGSLSD